METLYLILGIVLTILGLKGFQYFKQNFELQYGDITGISSSIISILIGLLLVFSIISDWLR